MEFKSVFTRETQQELRQSAAFGIKGLMALAHLRNMRSYRALSRQIIDGWIGGRNVSANDQILMAIINGEHARPLGDKSLFSHVVRSMGYQAADSMVVRVADNIEINQALLEDYYGDKGFTLFAKPLNGSWQRNLYDNGGKGLSLDDAKGLLGQLKEDYLVQEYLPTEKQNEWRYIRYRSKDGTVYCACFQYDHDRSEKPVKLPFIGQKMLGAQGVTINEMLTASKEHDPLPMPNDHGQLDRFNQFIGQFVEDLERQLGGEVPFLSMDIGIRDPSVFTRADATAAEMREAVVFYETQTSPSPWQLKKHGNKPNTRRAYFDMWKLMFKERGGEMLARALSSTKRTMPLA